MLNNIIQPVLNRSLFFLLLVLILGLFVHEFSPLFISLPIILIGITSIVHASHHSKNPRLFLIFALTFCASALTLIYSENVEYGLERLKIKLPMLVLALPWISMSLTKKQFGYLLNWFLFLTLVTTAIVLINYITNTGTINDLYKIGQVMPSPLNHIRFSLMIALSLHISMNYWRATKSRNKKWFFLIALFLLIFLHMYSVRTGLIAAYSVVFLNMIQGYKVKTNLIILTGLASIIIIFYYVSPTFKAKINDTKADLMVYKNKTYSNFYSITTRMISYEAALEVWKQNKLTGCGIGDIKDETDRYFKQTKPEIQTPILPHNQFLLILSSMGIIGLVVFLFSFYGILIADNLMRVHLIGAHYLIISISFLFEPMLETQLGVGFVMTFITIGILYKKGLSVSDEKEVL